MSYEYFYKGTPYSLEPSYGSVFSGYRVPAGELGATTSIQTANQIKEVTNLLNQGIKNVEISTIQPEVFEMIPKQHLQEINRLSKLTGTSASVHAPLIEASGYTKEGWDDAARKQAEMQMFSSVERSHQIDPKGNIPVTFHASAMLPLAEEKMKEKGIEIPKSMYIVDSRTGEIAQLKEKDKFFPGEIPPEYQELAKTQKFIPEIELKKINEEMWTRKLNDVNFYAARGSEYLDATMAEFKKEERLAKGVSSDIEEDKKAEAALLKAYAQKGREEILERFPEQEKKLFARTFRQLDHSTIFLRDSYNQLKELYNRVYKDAGEDDRAILDEYANNVKPIVEKGIEKDPEKLKQFSEEVIEKGIRVLSNIKNPKMYIPLNDFLINKSSETFGNVALKAYEKFGDNAPIVSIENPPIDNALSRAEDLKALIEASRKKFVDKAMQEKGLSKGEAERIAEKIIGATWDTSHIAMVRKFGFNEKDLIKEAEKIAPFVKHVHYNDNFGSSHTDLPPGMGNVPMKEILEKLEKAGFEGKKIFEGGGFFQNFQTSPHPYVLEGSGSPLYTMKAPYWNQMPAYGNYFAFPSSYLPEQHFSLYGGGFASLPMELGGQMPGKTSRASGTPVD